MRRLFGLACFLVLSWNAWAVEVEGVKLPETVHVGERDLVLNGAGVRSMFFFDMYVAALYLTEKKTSSDEIFASHGENRVVLHMLRDVSSETLSRSFNRSITINLAPAEIIALDAQLKQLAALFRMMSEATEGDVISLDYLPGRGTEINFNDVTIGTIKGADFNAALLKVWLGIKPVQGSLKRKLLGG